MKFHYAAACALAISPFFAALPVQAQGEASAIGTVTAPPGHQTGHDFAEAVMMNNMFEVETAKLALERSRSPAVRRFAADMVDAHRGMAADFKPVLDSTNTGLEVTPPPVFDAEHRDMYNALQASYGPDLHPGDLSRLCGLWAGRTLARLCPGHGAGGAGTSGAVG